MSKPDTVIVLDFETTAETELEGTPDTFYKPQICLYFFCDPPTRSLREGVWFWSVPLLTDDCSDYPGLDDRYFDACLGNFVY